MALELLVSGLDLEGAAWDDYVYHPTMWSDGGVERTKPASSQMDGLKRLREMSRNPSEVSAHFCRQPSFSGKELGLTGKFGGKISPHKADTASSVHKEVTKKIISTIVNDDLDPERVKKPRIEPEPTKEQVEKFDEDKKRVIAEKKKERKHAKKQSNKGRRGDGCSRR